MEIQIFSELTTEERLIEIESEAAKYEGLYVEMEDAEQRKFVKDHAAGIKSLLKKLDRARIDKTKASKISIDAEFNSIKTRLEDANKPFTTLINEYTIERKKVLDAEKARKQAILNAEQKELDHADAIIYDQAWHLEQVKIREAEALREKQQQNEREEYARQQVEAARIAEQQRVEMERQAEIEAEKQRLANIEHVRVINNKALSALIESGIDADTAKKVITLIAKRAIPNTSIKY